MSTAAIERSLKTCHAQHRSSGLDHGRKIRNILAHAARKTFPAGTILVVALAVAEQRSTRDIAKLDKSSDCKSLLQRFLLLRLGGGLGPDRCIGGDWLDTWLAGWYHLFIV